MQVYGASAHAPLTAYGFVSRAKAEGEFIFSVYQSKSVSLPAKVQLVSKARFLKNIGAARVYCKVIGFYDAYKEKLTAEKIEQAVYDPLNHSP